MGKINRDPQNSKESKIISFLATGSEIIQGDLQESNCYRFAKVVSKNGGEIYQHVHASDNKDEICSAIHYLLAKSDALIITGGLGPTSDDNTRFALADYIHQKLYFDENVWESIVQRLISFNLRISESNRQQAFFPVHSTLYPNKNGSAFGFCLRWKNKLIFVLPGPPKECTPMFEEHVMPTLEKEDFLHKQSILCWSTLGLIESEIAAQIDGLAANYNVQTAYRWHYPYLDIKIISEIPHTDPSATEKLVQEIDLLLMPYIVSYDRQNAFEILKKNLKFLKNTIYIFDDLTLGKFSLEVQDDRLKFIFTQNGIDSNKIRFNLGSSRSLEETHEYEGSIIFKCEGLFENKQIYFNEISVPYRNKEILEYTKHYAAWQLSKFIDSLNEI